KPNNKTSFEIELVSSEKFSEKEGKLKLSITVPPNRGNTFFVYSNEEAAPRFPLEVLINNIFFPSRKFRSSRDSQSMVFLKKAETIPLCSLTEMTSASASFILLFSIFKSTE